MLISPEILADHLLRIEARLSRRFVAGSGSNDIEYAGMKLETNGYRVRLDGRAIALSQLQTRLLEKFMLHPHRVFTREELARELWGDRAVEPKTINTAVLRLSRLLRNEQWSPIRSIRGVGYSLDAEIGPKGRS